MSSRRLFLISAASTVLAIASFAIGMAVFADRNEELRERIEKDPDAKVHLAEIVHAKRAAQKGSIVAGALLVVSIVSLSKGIGARSGGREARKQGRGGA